MVGAGLAAHDGVFGSVPVLIAFLASWLIHVAGVFADNHELLRRHPQVVEHADLTNAVRAHTLTLNQIKLAIGACLVIALPAAIFFGSLGGVGALLVGVIGVAASLGYAAGPFPYARLGLAEPVFFAMFGIVAVAGTYYVQVTWHSAIASHAGGLPATLPPAAFVVGLPVGALVTNVLVIDDMRDRGFDAVKQWRTIAVRFGKAGSRLEYGALTALAYLAPFAFWLGLGLGAWSLLPLATLPWAVAIARVVMNDDLQGRLACLTPKASLLSCAYAALLAVGIAVGARGA